MSKLKWPLSKRLFIMGAVFLVLALGSIALTLWVTWTLEGGAAAVNEAGRLRMQSMRFALAQRESNSRLASRDAALAMSAGFELLRAGDPSRPLFVPWDGEAREQFAAVEARWTALLAQFPDDGDAAPMPLLEAERLASQIDGFVVHIERRMSAATEMLRHVQFALAALAVAATIAFFYIGHLLVLEPLQRLRLAVARLGEDDFSARAAIEAEDEFGQLGAAFDAMAGHLQGLYGSLEARVADKTAHLDLERRRATSLYEISAFISASDALDSLAGGLVQRLRASVAADAVAIRWADSASSRYLMLAADGLPSGLLAREQCLVAGDCHCGQLPVEAHSRVIPISVSDRRPVSSCLELGFQTLASVPVRTGGRVLGEIDLFFRTTRQLDADELAMLETLASHLADRMESLRAAQLQREAAVAEERQFIARELHDSIAQSLAFLKIEAGLLRGALKNHDEGGIEASLNELESGIHESSADVRELLLHFRARAQDEDIVTALKKTLSKFRHQSGVEAELVASGHGVPLAADVQIQVLHIVQEALSNVRKHAHAARAVLTVRQAPAWQFDIVDDGIGFDPEASRKETRVGLRIMRERAQRIGAELSVRSEVGGGTRVTLAMPGTTLHHPPDHDRQDSTAHH
jgi:two-component system, NarL family, nitrate/nitrite sensor histidine kinase NarX